MITVSAKALWWSEPRPCVCEPDVERDFCSCDRGGWPEQMMFAQIDGQMYLTDRFVLMPVSRLTELPVAFDQVLDLRPLPGQAVDGFAEWLTLTPLTDPSDAMFHTELVDLFELAGFLLRPLPLLVGRTHAICDPDLSTVGLVTPVQRTWTPGAVGVGVARAVTV